MVKLESLSKGENMVVAGHYITEASLKHWVNSEVRLDVLHVVGSPAANWPMPSWFAEKSSRWTAQLKRIGFKAAAIVPQGLGKATSEDQFLEFILQLRPRMIVSRAFSIDSHRLPWLALRAPDIDFIQMNHTPSSFMLGRGRLGPESWVDAIDASKELENFWVGSVSLRDTEVTQMASPDARACWIPNPCRDDLYAEMSDFKVRDKEHLTIGLAGRVNYQKNFKNQLDAVAILARQRPVDLHLFLGHELMQGMASDLANYAARYLRAAGVKLKIMHFLPPLELIAYAKQHFDLFLQATFDESFGYLTWEMMAAGVPTISSESPEVVGVATVDPTSVTGIVEAMKMISDDQLTYRQAAIERARKIQENNNHYFDMFFRQRLEGHQNEQALSA